MRKHYKQIAPNDLTGIENGNWEACQENVIGVSITLPLTPHIYIQLTGLRICMI